MPLYEYKCENCGDVFELIEKFSDTPLTVHTKCGGKVHRLISAPALQFKGSGWYITDYAKGSGSLPNGKKGEDGKRDEGGKSEGSKNEGSKSTGSKDDGGSSKSSSGSDSKPAATPASTSSDSKSNS